MFGWHHRLNGHELEQTLVDSEGQGSLACCSPWGHKELDTTEWLNNNQLNRAVSWVCDNILLNSLIIFIQRWASLACLRARTSKEMYFLAVTFMVPTSRERRHSSSLSVGFWRGSKVFKSKHGRSHVSCGSPHGWWRHLVTLANSETPVLQPIGMSFIAFTPVGHRRWWTGHGIL